MRQPSSIEPFTPSPTIVLHPALQAALDNLDVQIEEELTRYRRQRRYSTPATLRRKPFPAPSGATAIGILKTNIQLPTPRSSIYDSQAGSNSQATYNQVGNQTVPRSVNQSVNQSVRQSAASPSSQIGVVPVVKSAKSSLPTPERTVSSSPVAFTSEARRFESQAANEPASARIASYAEQNDLSAYAPTTLQKFIHPPAPYAAPDAPDDYLASSEELLRSIAEEDRELGAERDSNPLLDTLLTPLGVGSMLLLILASTTVGYVIMNPTSLGLWAPDATPEPSANNPSANPAASNKTANNTENQTAPSPDLASDEFVDLDLDTLSTLPKQSRSGRQPVNAAKSKSSTAKANSAATTARRSASTSNTEAAAPLSTSPEIPVAPAPQPSLSTVVVPAAPPVMSVPEPATAPAPAPVSPEPISTAPPPIEPAPVEAASSQPASEPAPVEPVPEPAPSVATAPAQSNSYYYVVTEYSGDASLQEARSAVPDAYVRNLPSDGAKVQLGAFSDQNRAQELLQQLQQQGIEAEVYTP